MVAALLMAALTASLMLSVPAAHAQQTPAVETAPASPAPVESPESPALPAAEQVDAPLPPPDAESEADAGEARAQALTHYAIARQLLQAGRLPQAIAEYRKAAELDPASLTVKMELASALLAAGERADSQKLYEQIVQQHQQAVEAHFQLARMALGQRDADAARKHFEQILLLDEKDRPGNRFYPLALYYLALSADEKKDHAASVDYFHQLVLWLGKADDSFKHDREIGRLLQILPQLVAKTAQLHLLQKQPEQAISVVQIGRAHV